MKEKSLTIPDIGFIAGTRVALGVGIGLLVSGGLNKDRRHAAGWVLIGVGVVTTIPILMRVLAKRCDAGKPALVA